MRTGAKRFFLVLPYSVQKCGGSRKLVIPLLVSSCYRFGVRGIVSCCLVVFSVPLKGIKPFG